MKIKVSSPRLSRQTTKRLTLKVRSILKHKDKIIKKLAKPITTIAAYSRKSNKDRQQSHKNQ
jgi:hypothetical protein